MDDTILDPEPEKIPELPEDASQAWRQWQVAPGPRTLSNVLRKVQPTIDSAVSKYPKINPAVIGGEARRMAIQAIKTYNPQESSSLSTHVFNHMRPLARYTQDVSRAVGIPRDAREQFAKVKRAETDFYEEHNRHPTEQDLQYRLGISRGQLDKLRQLGQYEVPEGSLDYSPNVQQEDPWVGLWADYVYHDLSDRDKLIMDHRTGRNGREVLPVDVLAAKLGIHPSLVNRRTAEIAKSILDGINSKRKPIT